MKQTYLASFVLIACCAAIIPHPASAQVDGFDEMSDAQRSAYCAAGHGDTPSVNQCAQYDFDLADAELNRVYRHTLKQLDTQIRAQKNEPSFRQEAAPAKTSLIQAQRWWVKFKEAECTARYNFNATGTIRNSIYLSCLTDLTRERTAHLRAVYGSE